MKLQAPEADPELGALNGAEEQGCDQEEATDQQEQVAVPLEVAPEADREQRENVEADADAGPTRLSEHDAGERPDMGRPSSMVVTP